MDLPEAVLAIANSAPQYFDLEDFRMVFASGVAAMLTERFQLAQSRFALAQRLVPEEPAPYVNMTELLLAQGLGIEAAQWWEAGLGVAANHFRLWELALSVDPMIREGTQARRILELAERHQSWAGYALAAELDPDAHQITKLGFLQPFYAAGERSPEFLIEYTGALGVAGAFDEIPPIVWAAERLAPNTVPWELLLHGAQAQLALEKPGAFLEVARQLQDRQDFPGSLRPALAELVQEVSQEIAERQPLNPC